MHTNTAYSKYITDGFLVNSVECFFPLSFALTLPERQEDDRFDSEELEYGIEGSEELLGCEVEEEEGVQGQGDADVIDQSDVNVALAGTEKN